MLLCLKSQRQNEKLLVAEKMKNVFFFNTAIWKQPEETSKEAISLLFSY